MPTSVTMPQLGESVTEGTVTRWLKQEGEQVEADEPLLEVSTDKVDTEIPSPASGVLHKIMVAEDETVQVGAELAIIGEAGEAAGSEDSGGSEQAAQSEPAEQPKAETADSEQPEQAQPEQTSSEQTSSEQVSSEQTSSEQASAESEPEQPAQAQDRPAEQEPTQPAAEQAPQNDDGDGSGGSGSNTSGSGTSVTMPALGESVTEGTVTPWLKSVGDSIEADEPLLEVSTDKVDTEIPAPASGTLLSISVGEDETVQVGAELAVIGSADASDGQSEPAQAPTQAAPAAESEAESGPAEAGAESGPAEAESAPAEAEAAPAEPEAAEPAPAPRAETPAAPDAQPPSESPATPSHGLNATAEGGAYVTPLVRKLAAEHKVDLGSVTGTGVGGRIRKQDVLDAAAGVGARQAAAESDASTKGAPAAAAPQVAAQSEQSKRGRTEKLTRLRSLIGRRMIESLQVSAQLTTVVEVDITRVARLRDRLKKDFEAREGVKLSFLPFFALAAVEALKAHPMVNSSIDSDAGTITYHDSENLGIAVDTERGLLVPVIHNAGDLNLGGIARKIADLAERTRDNKVTPDELGGGTFTLTNTGSRGALFDTPIINQPQVAILGTGTVVKRPVVVDDPDLGEIVTVRSMVYLALTYDHRIVDGADAARFLVNIKERLEAGDFESSLGLS